MGVVGPINSGAAAGSAGSATSNATTNNPITGHIAAVYVKYNDSPPNTTDVTIATAGTNAPANTILTLTDAATNGWFYPRHQVHSSAGAALTLDGTRASTDMVYIDDLLKVTIAQADAADNVDVWLMVC